jgi:hypothetical protein
MPVNGHPPSQKWRTYSMARVFTTQQLSDFLFDRIIVNCPKCLDTRCLKIACTFVAEELTDEADIIHKFEQVSDGGA